MSPLPPPSSWMQEIPGHYNVTQITIPGTHDSHATADKILSGRRGLEKEVAGPILTALAQCQDLEMWEQLQKGVRYFDLRVSSLRDFGNGDWQFGLCHASVRLGENLKVVTDGMADFLRNHPTETIFVCIKWDEEDIKLDGFSIKSVPVASDDNLRHGVNDIWERHGWYSGSEWPELDSVRGKAILLRRFSGPECENFGIDTVGFWDQKDKLNGDGKWSQIESPSQSGLSFDERWNRTTDNLEQSKNADFDDNVMHFTGMADSKVDGLDSVTPRDYAEVINPRLRSYLKENENINPDTSRFGIVVTDFCCEETAKQIFAMNFTT